MLLEDLLEIFEEMVSELSDVLLIECGTIGFPQLSLELVG
jgi:hypothetical protein